MAEHTSMTEAYIELVRKLVVPVPGLEQGGVREATRLQEAADMDVFGNFDFSTLWLAESKKDRKPTKERDDLKEITIF